MITLVLMRGTDGVRALRWLLKRARRQFGLIAVDVRAEEEDDHAESQAYGCDNAD